MTRLKDIGSALEQICDSHMNMMSIELDMSSVKRHRGEVYVTKPGLLREGVKLPWISPSVSGLGYPPDFSKSYTACTDAIQ
jgi:hypothetical protein